MNKKKARIPHHSPNLGQADQYNSRRIDSIIKAELHKLSSPVEHIDPKTIDPEQLEQALIRARFTCR